MDYLKIETLYEVGRGGIRCGCCKPYRSSVPQKIQKMFLRRFGRRKLKYLLQRELANISEKDDYDNSRSTSS